MNVRRLAIATVALPLFAAGPASAGQFITGGAAEAVAVPRIDAPEILTSEEAASTASQVDLQPLRAPGGGATDPVEDSVGATGRMLKLYYDVPGDSLLRPYLGAGVGFASPRPNELTCMSQCSSLADADRAIGYQFMAGVTYEIKKDVTFFAEHRLTGRARSSILDNDVAGARLDIDGPRDRAFGGGIRIGF